MTSLVEHIDGRSVGSVEYVAADRISVLLHAEAPQATALNTGTPQGFPRINSYVLIPNESGATVGLVVSIHIERLPYPKRKGTAADFGLVDLPFPSRMMSVAPIGTLVWGRTKFDADPTFEVRRGVDVFPSVGDPVAIPTAAQLRAIVEGEGQSAAGRIVIGTSPMGASAPVHVDPNKLFGRHLAVLGNTGAGKSCTVAGLVRWSVEAARAEREKQHRPATPHARFIVLDVNGEYGDAFTDLGVRRFSVAPHGEDGIQLQVPAWFWNGDEWSAFVGAAPGVQRPVLLEALRRLRAGGAVGESFPAMLQRQVSSRTARLLTVLDELPSLGAGQGPKEVGQQLRAFGEEFAAWAKVPAATEAGLQVALNGVAAKCDAAHRSQFAPWSNGTEAWKAFRHQDIEPVVVALSELAAMLTGGPAVRPVSENDPVPFRLEDLGEMVGHLATGPRARDLSAFVDTLKLRIRGLFASDRLSSVGNPDQPLDLGDWLDAYVGTDGSNGTVSVLDLSLVPTDLVHVVVAVLSRLVFEAVQRYRRDTRMDLPTVLVLEEAHTFISRDAHHESAPPASRLCCRVMERIAREGRKFGLGLVISSQRPAELSETILSQCNTFLLHRLVNERDQDLVRKLVPDGLGSALRELPSLPSRRAILLGWAAPTPLLVEIRELPGGHRPRSPDPAFWQVWVGDPVEGSRPLNWRQLAAEWAGVPADDVEEDEPTWDPDEEDREDPGDDDEGS